jgi:hypothetical protein
VSQYIILKYPTTANDIKEGFVVYAIRALAAAAAAASASIYSYIICYGYFLYIACVIFSFLLMLLET